MNRSLALVSSAALLAVSASAQCFTATGTSIVSLMAPTSTYSIDDEGRSSDILLPFTFPIGGQNWTHMVVESNGEIYLTMGSGVVGPAVFGISGTVELTGVAGDSPRVCAFGGDLQGVAGLATWDVLVDDTVAGQVKVSWTGMRQYFGSQDFAMSATLFNSGAVQFDYNGGNFETATTAHFAAVSAGNGILANAPQDLSAGGDTGTAEICYQNTWGPFDLELSSIFLVPNGTGGFAYLRPCYNPAAEHFVQGAGCYSGNQQKAAYSNFGNTGASAVLGGQSQLFVPAGNGYTILPQAGTPYTAPGAGAVALALTDDSEVDYTPATPFNYLGTTPISTISICSNGFINMGPVGGNSVYAYASVFELHNATVPSFRANADYNPAAAGSGQVYVEETAGMLTVTWAGVYRWNTTSPEDMQFQLDLNSGTVSIAYGTMATTGGGLVLGCNTGAGTSTDFGSIAWPAGYPTTTSDVDVVSPPMSLTASPAPVLGTLVDYTVNDAQDYIPGFDIGVVIISASSSALPLQFLDPTADPACIIRVGSLDATLAFAAPSGPQTVQFQIPAGAPTGVSIFVQAVALVPGLNNFLGGIQLSNGIESYIESY